IDEPRAGQIERRLRARLREIGSRERAQRFRLGRGRCGALALCESLRRGNERQRADKRDRNAMMSLHLHFSGSFIRITPFSSTYSRLLSHTNSTISYFGRRRYASVYVTGFCSTAGSSSVI